MRGRAVGILIVGGFLAALIGLLILPSRIEFGTEPGKHDAHVNLKVLCSGLGIYHNMHGVLPCDSRGSSYALYLLKDVMEGDASFFADPLADAKGLPAPRFDDERKMLVGSHFAYLNGPRPPAEDVILLAEVPGLNPKRRYYLTLNDTVGSIDAETDPLANQPLLGLRLVDGKFVPTRSDASTSAESGPR